MARSERCWTVKCSDFGMETDCPLKLNEPQCGQDICLFTLYRIAVFFYFFTYFVYDMVTTIGGFDGIRTFIFLTTWVYIMVNVYVTIAFVNTLIDVYRLIRYPPGAYAQYPSFRCKLQWFVFNIALNGSIVVSIGFWILYGQSNSSFRADYFPNMLRNLSLHLLPAIITVLDLLVTAVPVRFVHVIYPIIFGFGYVCFAVVYWRTGGTNPWGMHFIYPMIDFENNIGGACLYLLVMTAVAIGVQAVLKAVYMLRELATAKLRDSYGMFEGSNPEHRRLTESTIEMSGTPRESGMTCDN